MTQLISISLRKKAEGIYDLEVAETVLGAGEYVSGAVTAADGYTVTGVKVSYGVDKTVDVKFNAKTGKFNFKMPAGNVTVTAEYEAIDYKVEVTEKTLADKGEVTLTVGGVAAEVFHVGDVVTVKTKVENGYKHTISVKDAEGNSLLADGAETSTVRSITFTMPAGDVSIEVSYQGRTYGITSSEAEYKNEDRDYTAPDGTELPTYSVAESASAGSEVVISTTGLGEKDSVQFVVTSLGEQLVDKDDNDETFTFDMPIGAVTIDVKFDIFVQEIADAQAVYAEAVETAEKITAKTETVKTATAALNKAVEDEKAAENAKPVVTAAAGDCEVVLTWTAPEGATKYAVYSYLNGKYYAQGTTTATTATVKNLTNGTKYGFLVRAYVNGTWTSFTSADVVYAAPAVSSKPVLTVTARDGEAVLVWTAPAGATKYNVYSYLNGKYYAQGTTTATTSTVKNLTNGTKYGFLVRAFVNGAWSTFTSDDIVYATPAEYPGSFCLGPMV